MHAAGTCTNVASPTKDELAAAHLSVCTEFLAAFFLSGANRDRYSALRNELANQYTSGNDLYPKTMDQCLTMLNHRVDNVPRTPGPPHQPPVGQPVKQEDEALVFAQGTNNDKPTKGKPTNDSASKSSSSSGSVSCGTKYRMVICKNCGQQGHVSSVCPQKKPPEQVRYLMQERGKYY